MQLGYHNHFVEFHEHDGFLPYDELLRLTDPKLVAMEMDCGWVVIGGHKPEEYLTRYPDRLCDAARQGIQARGVEAGDGPVSTEMGRGSIDYASIFAAAKKARIRHIFVEQEAFPDMPAMDALKTDADWLSLSEGFGRLARHGRIPRFRTIMRTDEAGMTRSALRMRFGSLPQSRR